MGDKEDLPNVVKLRKRTLQEIMEYLGNQNPEYDFGIIYSSGKWIGMVRDKNDPQNETFYPSHEPENALTIATAFMLHRDRAK